MGNEQNSEQLKEILEQQKELQLQSFKQSTDKIIIEKIAEYKQKQDEAPKSEKQKKGKTLNDFLDFTNAYTSNASTVNRSLALGGIAIIWIFKRPDPAHPIIKGLLDIPLLLLAASLALDLLQYFFGAVAWKIFYERKYWIWKKKKSFESSYASDITAPNFISVPIYILWLLKIVSMMVAYYFLIVYVTKEL
ncbi:MAG TPA: hypothetical protein VK772_11765 [Puia sp.]|jgi:hypothetical protein|nr:hypothetical protein [Puia sp.]